MIALTFMLVIAGYTVAALVSGYLIHRLTKRKCSFTLCSGVLLSLPVIYIAYLILPGYFLLQLLCNSTDRTVVYRTAHASGYLHQSYWNPSCPGSWSELLKHGYEYVECSKDPYLNSELLDSRTYYRFTIEPMGHAGCKNTFSKDMEYGRKRYSREFSNLLSGKCLAVQIINTPQSKYGVLFTGGYVDFLGRHITDLPDTRNDKRRLVRYSEVRTIELATEKTLSVSRNYRFNPLGSYLPMYAPHRCDELQFNDIKIVIAPK